MMEFKDLKIFQSVAAHGSISRAAKSLNYVQSYVTSRIQALESELGTQLFIRHSKGTTLTADGEKLQGYAENIIAAMNNLEKAFRDTGQPSGRLNIGTVESITKLPEILSMFRRRYPDVSLSIDSDVTKNISSKVIDGQLDCAFVTGFGRHGAINKTEIFQERLVLVSDEAAPLDDLKEKPMLVFKKGCNYRRNLEQWLEDEGVKSEKIVEFGTLETIIGSVKSGLGVSLVPVPTVYPSLESGELYSHELPDEYSIISTDFIWHKDAFLTSSMKKFIETVQEYEKNHIQ